MLKKSPSGKNKKVAAQKEGKEKLFPIVAIGASAGGLEAVSKLLKSLPTDTGMAFFYVQHLSPDHQSNLALLLSQSTPMKVHEAKNLLRIEPNNLYVCTPNKEMTLVSGKIKLTLRNANKLPYLPIDVFFNSLAREYKKKVIGIILSGNATDGTQGLKAIKEAGGITFVQDNSAKYGSMPKSAINASIVDFVLSPREIAQELARIGTNGFATQDTITDNNLDLKTVFEILRREKGVDFSHYKMTTIKRRLNYRMLHSGVKTIKEYVKLLQKKNDEAEMLYKDLLINVTSFFRDAETFRYLKTTFLPKLLSGKSPDQTLRIWVPACSTGEEAYSIAMLIAELQDNKTKKIPVQIFATDLSELVIKDARIGEYSQRDLEPVDPNRVKRFFTKVGDRYRIAKELREICVFAPHNILRDPPFSRMDFISCCNLLIYFDTTAQKKALATLSFALNDGGYLMLGKSESIGTSSHFFNQINNKFKIYSRKKNVGIRKIPELTPRFPETTVQEKNKKLISKKNTAVDSKELDGAIDAILLSRYMPACAIINKDMDIIKFRGTTSLFLSHSSGNASLNILKMTRPEFAFELRSIIHKAFKTEQTVRKTGIEIKTGSSFRIISLEASPLKSDWDEPLLLIVFSLQKQIEKYIENEKGKKHSSSSKDRKIKKLTEELNTSRAEMHSIIEDQETSNEELQAANEEIVSTNEEFQTLNEELETTKEEIEATNEELISTNHELQMRNNLLTESYKYSEAIIATIHEPMLILDSNLHVKSANTSFYKKFLVHKAETEGMSLYELGNKQWDIPKLHELLSDIVSQNTDFKNLEITHTFQGIGERIVLLNAHRIIQKTHGEQLILLAIEDITERTRHYLKEKEALHKDIRGHKADKRELEKAVTLRTRELNQKNIELEEANKDLTSFTYISSHDLQEPLRKIKNFASVLLEEEEKRLSSDGKRYLHRTYEVAKRMQTLIEDLLLYSRTKNTERKFEKTRLNEILYDVKKDFEDIIQQKKAKIKIGKLCETNIIKFQFRQLLHNLLGNSLKFSKSGTVPRITITSEIVQGSKLNNQKLSTKIDYCHLIYTDNGIGFDPQYNERIFEVFQRLHSIEEYNGTGMGLAICKRIVENHGGIITATGKLNMGAQFDIYIPAE
ncbi:MAG TPA: chemotaxis protein CheB [Bacteroidia bacterium]|nr:chemotaxis protein CheB [Bacteroidia bacterium]